MHPRRTCKECSVEPTLPHIRACCCSSRSHIHPAACSNVARSRTVPAVHSGGRCEHGMRRVSHVRGREGRVRRFVRRGWGTAVMGVRDTVRWQSFTKWALSWEYDRNTRRVACRRRVGAGCGGAVGPRANGGSHQRGFWGRRAGGAAGTPVGKRDIEGETYRDIEPKQHGAERHGGGSPRVLPHAPSKRG